MKNALIIFVRNAELGKVKTRLAAQMGNEKTLEIYIKLLQHTRQVASEADCDKYVFTTEPLKDTMWKDFTVKQQAEGNLGEKMSEAFKSIFAKKYEKVIIIGSDCPSLSKEIIEKGFEELGRKDAVIGPSEDGGYYLLGIKKLSEKLFQDKNWSTSSVYYDTIKDFEKYGINYHILPTLIDVDEEKDIPDEWR